MLFVKLILASIVLAIGLALLGFWLGWKPAVGIPLGSGVVTQGTISMAGDA